MNSHGISVTPSWVIIIICIYTGVICRPDSSWWGKKNSNIISLEVRFLISNMVEWFSSIYTAGISTFKAENSRGHFKISQQYGTLISLVAIVPVMILHFRYPSSRRSLSNPITFWDLTSINHNATWIEDLWWTSIWVATWWESNP